MNTDIDDIVDRTLHVDKHTHIYRTRSSTNEFFIVKTHNSRWANERDHNRLVKEYEIGKHLTDARMHHIVPYLQLTEQGDSEDRLVRKRKRMRIIMEDFDGRNLRNVIPDDGFPLPIFLDIAE